MPTNDLHKELRILNIVDVYKLFTLRLIYQHQTFKLPITFKEYFKVRNETPQITENSISPKQKQITAITLK